MKKVPKKIESFFFFYPTIQITFLLILLIHFLLSVNILNFIGLVLVSYFLSPFIWYFVRRKWGDIGTHDYLGKKTYHGNLWYISYQLQFLYNSFSFFEKLLRFIPGAYSFWLRLWGSKIGKKVNWAPDISIIDRNSLVIGDRVLIGNKSYISSHALKKREVGRYQVYFKKIVIGEDSILSYASSVAPGTVIGKGCFIPAKSNIYPNTKLDDGEKYVDSV